MQNGKTDGQVVGQSKNDGEVVERKKIGRPRGVPNRTTKENREAIAKFVTKNLEHLDEWLLQVAQGLPKVDVDGEPIRDHEGSIVYVVRPSPLAALNTLSNLAEFHIPRLKSIEATVAAQVEHVIDSPIDIKSLSTDDLKRLILQNAGIDAIDLEPEPVKEKATD